MSTIKMMESTPDDELTQLRRQAANKDNCYATLENELLKKNNDLVALKDMLDDTLSKLRNEADRALKLESDLNRRVEDLRAERLNRQNLEASLTAANERLTSEEQSARHLQMELETYASRTASQHALELKRIQHEKSTLEARVRAFEAQVQAQTSAPKPTRLPRPTTFSNAASTAPDARIATLECALATAERELATARAKVPHLQADVIAAENARMCAEKVAKAEKVEAESVREVLEEREEELEYWRGVAAGDEGRMEEVQREHDEALKREAEARRREDGFRRRVGEMEERETELVIDREEALNELHRLQAENAPSNPSPPGDNTAEPDNTIITDLRAALEERDSALRNARGYASELQQMYRDTMRACDDAEARVRALEREARPPPPPLVIVSPPPSPSQPCTPFLAHPQPFQAPAQPMFTPAPSQPTSSATHLQANLPPLSPTDEAIIARLLTAIERLRAERDALRREIYFVRAEARVGEDMWRAKVENAERGVSEREQNNGADENDADAELQLMRVHVHEIEELKERIVQESRAREGKAARAALAAFVVVQHLRGEMDGMEKLWTRCEELGWEREELKSARDEAVRNRELLEEVHERAETRLAEVIRSNDDAQERLHAEYARIEERDAQIAALETCISGLRHDLSCARALNSAQPPTSLGTSTDALHVLEQRVLRRTEQIGMLQHDTRRLETNLRVAEDTIGELTTELETVAQERACLVEDCAQAREARDAAQRRVEELEVEVEMLGRGESTGEVEGMVRVVVESVAQSRGLSARLERAMARLAATETSAGMAEDGRAHALSEVDRLSAELDVMTLTLHDRTAAIDVLTHELALARDETCRVSAAFESDAQDGTSRTQQLNATVEDLEGQLAAAQVSENTLSQELDAARLREQDVEARLGQVQEESKAAVAEVQRLTAAVAALKQTLAVERSAHFEATERFEQELGALEAEVEENRRQLESLRADQDITSQTQELTATVEDLEGQLAAAQASEDSLSQELDAARLQEQDTQVRLEQVQEESRLAEETVQKLIAAVATLEGTLELERSAHSEATEDLEKEIAVLKAEVEEGRMHLESLRVEYADAIEDLTTKLEDAQSHLADAETSHDTLEREIRRLKSDHADELLVLRSRLEQAAALHAQLQTATDAVADLEAEILEAAARYDAAQVEIRGLEHALAGARTQVDEHDASIQALQREKTTLQVEHTRLEAELDRVATKHQYVEQQAKRSDHDVMRLKSEVERLRGEAAKFDEAAQAAEISLSFKTNQFEQKLTMIQRELQKQQSHRQCQESIAELNEKNEYLEEMLRMKSVEIEENDDRFIDALKEKKRLASKVESLTRKVQSLQTKIAASAPAAAPSTSTPPLPVSRPKTPSPPMPPIPSAGPSTRPPTRIPSSPAVALRARTPEPSRRTFASRIATPEPPLPPFPNISHKTPERAPASRPASRVDLHRLNEAAPSISHTTPAPSTPTPLSSGSRKRRAPDDFDSPVPLPAQAIVAPSGNTTPRHLRRPTNEGRSGFTPTRNAPAPFRPAPQQASPLRRSTAPLAESTNSPRGNRPIGLGKPASATKPPMRSWLSRTRAPTTVGGDPRSTSALGVRP